MGLTLDSVVPWGRSLDEYCRMFALSDPALQLALLDCGGGPASFNAELTQRGGRVISCDPLYQFSVEQIEQRIQATYPVIIEGVRAHAQAYVWQSIKTPDELGAVRMRAMQQFLRDFPNGKAAGRYVVAALPTLPFADCSFDLALCGHLLFSYSDQHDGSFHQHSILELCRVARQVRIFPLLTVAGHESPWLQPVVADLTQRGYRIHIAPVAYEFQKGGNQLLVISNPKASTSAV